MIQIILLGTAFCWRNNSGIKLSAKPTQAASAGNRGRSSIRIGQGYGLKETTSTMSSTEEKPQYVTRPPIRNHRNAFNLTIGIVLPFKSFGTRDYLKSITSSIEVLKKKEKGKLFTLTFKIDMLALTPSPIRKYDSFSQ